MSKIKLLQEDVINKIAAGEVVQRPASVIKELLENSVDAGATQIRVELNEGGCKNILVSDNGAGISVQELPLALMRHATSKIEQAEDLYSLDTMGFRGEALASIASVSQFTLQSRRAEDAQGAMILVRDGQSKTQSWFGQAGTHVQVQNLFYNIPARLKFLKSTQTEYSYCLETLQDFALAHPTIELTLLHNNKEVLRAAAVCNQEIYSTDYIGEEYLKARIQQIYPKEELSKFIYTKHRDRYFQYEMVLSPPGLEKSSSKSYHFFVNQRVVKDVGLRTAVYRGYHSHLLKGKYPQVYLFLKMEPSLVDVNVHPSKTEVRFQYQQDLYDSIARSIRSSIRQGAWAAPKDYSFSQDSGSEPQFSVGLFSKSSGSQSVAAFSFNTRSSSASYPAISKENVGRIELKQGSFESSTPHQNLLKKSTEDSKSKPIEWSDLTYLGCFARCYLIFETSDQEQMLVVDQHAFHERILYEKLTQDHSMLKQSQSLLVPEEVELDISQIEQLQARSQVLNEFGFVWQKISDFSIEVQAVPAILNDRSIAQIFSELTQVDQIDDSESTHHLLATIACHSAVRAGEELSQEDLKVLLSSAQGVDFYLNCPHGRRVFSWWSKRQVASWFDRT